MSAIRAKEPPRLLEIDVLRPLAMLTIFFFHTARFFNFEDWHVKNLVLSQGVSAMVMFVSNWVMPLFFILSSISVASALRKRSAGEFIGERAKRLLVPLIFGIFVIAEPQVYIERISHGEFAGSFFDFYPRYFDGWYGFGGNFAWMGLHLWYLLFLFVFSLLLLFPFRALLPKIGKEGTSLISRLLARPESIYLLALPLIVVELWVNRYPETIGNRSFGGWSPITYFVFFIIGFLLSSHQIYSRLERFRYQALAGALVVTGVSFLLYFFDFFEGDGVADYLYQSAVLPTGAWLWVVSFIGFSKRYLSVSNAMTRYANEAVLPFYILHQTVIVITGYFIIEWAAPVSLKYLFLASASFIVIMAMYELCVRRFSLTRFLFGMKGKR